MHPRSLVGGSEGQGAPCAQEAWMYGRFHKTGVGFKLTAQSEPPGGDPQN